MSAVAPTAAPSPWQGFGIHKGELFVAVGVIITLLVMIFPLPRILLDLLLSFNLTFSLMVLLLSLYTVKPIEFFIFPNSFHRTNWDTGHCFTFIGVTNYWFIFTIKIVTEHFYARLSGIDFLFMS